MSYDIRIYTIEKQDFNDLKTLFEITMFEDGFVYPFREHQIVVSKETPIEGEDIPQQICKELPGLKFLIECNLEPITYDEKYIKELLKISKAIAKNGIGVIEDIQTGVITLASGAKRVLKTEKTEYFSILELSWWFNDINSILQNDGLKKLLHTFERYMPEALPRRYGEYEPPKEIFTDVNAFHDYLLKNMGKFIIWYPNKPVDNVDFSIPDFIGPIHLGYRFGKLAVSIDSRVLTMPGWKASIIRLFKHISSILNPFYGDIYVLKNQIKSRPTSYTDESSEMHPVLSWWWNGIPKKLGCGIIVGAPLHDFVKIKKADYELENGCKIIINDNFEILPTSEIEINKNIYQPKIHARPWDKITYAKIWPFKYPFAD